MGICPFRPRRLIVSDFIIMNILKRQLDTIPIKIRPIKTADALPRRFSRCMNELKIEFDVRKPQKVFPSFVTSRGMARD